MTWKKIWSKRFSIRLGEAWFFGSKNFQTIHGCAFPNQRIIIEDGFGTGYVDEDALIKLQQHLVELIRSNGFDIALGAVELQYEDFLEYAKGIGAIDFTSYSRVELLNTYENFLEKEDEWMHYMWPIFVLDEGLTPVFQDFMKNVPSSSQEEVSHAVLTPERLTAAGEYRNELLQLSSKRYVGEELDRELRQIQAKYIFFPILNLDEDFLSLQSVRDAYAHSVQEEKDHPKSLEKETKSIIDADLFFNSYVATISPSERNLLIATRRIGYLREYRNDVRQEAYAHVRNLYDAVARQGNRTLSDVIYCTRNEIMDFLSSNKTLPSIDDIARRKSYSLMEFSEGVVTYTWSRKSSDIMFEEKTNVKEFMGTVAYKGKVHGVARIVLDGTQDAERFMAGDILVSTTTNLAYVPLMGKASAVVTEEGGLLTHTAIVARELKKPCIIGTKIATKVLKDGDLVEVDADKGIVTILKHANA